MRWNKTNVEPLAVESVSTMGASIDAWVEYDEHGEPPFSMEPEVLPLTDWLDLSSAKDYRVYGALSGIRNSNEIPPLFPRRGLPPNPNWQISRFIGKEDFLVSWLHPSEITQALAHHSVLENEMSLEMRCLLKTIDFLASTIGDRRVRFVFEIE